MRVLGIDVGGSGIKGAPVDVTTGEQLAERVRIETPQPAEPDAVAGVVAELARRFDWDGPIGCGFPAAIRDGRALTAANISQAWLGHDARGAFSVATGCPVTVINDADAAGLAELRFGAARGRGGVVMVFTLGTGIGSALFVDGTLVPNTELGHVEIDGREAERWASAAVRENKELSWKKWSERLDVYLKTMHALFWPELIVLGGGVSKKSEKFIDRLTVDCDVVPASLLNSAGIVGAALAAAG